MKKVIFDTDFATDVGDLGAFACVLSAHRVGWFDLIGVIVDASYTYSPGAVSATAKWWQVNGLTLGCWKGTSIDGTISNMWCKAIYDNFDRDGVGLASTVTDSTVAYRTMLAAQEDASVDIIAVGYLNALSDLLDSTADGISSLTGSQLVSAKVRTLWVMGGNYPGGAAEWNFIGGATPIASICTATNNICSNWPTPIRFAGYELGTITAGGTFGRATTDLVSMGYTTHGSTSGRTAWDEMAVLACIQEGADFALTHGSQTVNTTTGAQTWTASESGKDAYLSKSIDDAALQSKLNALIGATVTNSPLISSWGSAQQFMQLQAREA